MNLSRSGDAHKASRFLPRLVQAAQVLDANWMESYTRPAADLYPHQWSWDAAFIAIGYAWYAPDRAMRELTSLFAAQWSNGMVPHIVFDPRGLGRYFPEPDFWQTHRSPHAPRHHQTSGLTQPPVHAMAAWRVYEHAPDRDVARAWLRRLYPRLLAAHAYLYRDRDPDREGLVHIRHPWESGRDNSPAWDAPLRAIAIDPEHLPAYSRRDLDHGVPPEQRPDTETYHRFVFLVDQLRQADYNERVLAQTAPFRVQDPLFNAVLVRANEDLARIAEVLGEDPDRPRAWAERTRHALRKKLWNPRLNAFDAYDLVAGRHVHRLTAAAFIPFLAGAPYPDQARALYLHLESHSFCPMHDGACFSIPTYQRDGTAFETQNYWRGPVWININWLLKEGLLRYGHPDRAQAIAEDILELVLRWGFREYFDPYSGNGYGAHNFSWTAALFLDTAFTRVLSR